MDIKITKELLAALGEGALSPWGIDDERVRWTSCNIDLRRHSNNSVKKLRDIILPQKTVKGAGAALRDMAVWIAAAESGAEKVKCRNAKHFAALVFEFMQKQPGHRLYSKDEDRDCWRAYHVGGIDFIPRKVERSGGVTPAHVNIATFYMELGRRRRHEFTVWDSACSGQYVAETLSQLGYLVQTPDLLAEYEENKARYIAFHDKIGLQFWASGIGTDNLDGNTEDRYRWHIDTIQMSRGGERSRVVIDVVNETDKDNDREKDDHFNADFWRTKSLLEANPDEDLEDIDPDDSEPDAPVVEIDIPLFPVVPTFDLRRHTRLRIHIANLEEYVYDPKLGDKLVLPEDVRDLVSLLVSDKSEFRDIIRGKGNGAVILCAGPPGCGKTLTAEVYAEVIHRPLYSVQCSQLGTDEESLEKELMKVFSRAQRWNAILLLDEADVYVLARGSDMQQNAIVGVFLRVLEYYTGVLFMTTNRSDLVDDAITSRCLARIDYAPPSQADQAKIWNILAEGAGLKLHKTMVTEIVSKFPRLSGRDVKQLLKLAGKVAASRGETEITSKTVEFVKRFKPTPGDGKAEVK